MLPDWLLDRPLWLEVALQSAIWLGLGLGAARLLADRPARAHAALLAGIVAGIVAPALAIVAHRQGWGLFNPPAPAVAAATVIPDSIPARRAAETAPLLARAALAAWLLLSTLLLLRLALGFAAARRLARSAAPVSDAALRAAADRAAAALGLHAPPLLREAAGLPCPLAWCWGRDPVVLLPAEATAALDARAWEAIFRHELAHRRRGDHVGHLLASLAVALLPWHPLAWRARRRLEQCADEACDRWVVAGGVSADVYADLLLAFAPRRGTLCLAFAARRGDLATRLRRLLDARECDPRAGRAFAALGAAAVLAGAAATALAQDRAAAPAPRDATALPALPDAWLEAIGDADDLVLLPERLDFGVVAPEGSGVGLAWLVNPTDRVLDVAAIRASCGCTTVAGLEPGPVAPGAVIPFEVTMVAPAEIGVAKEKVVTITTGSGTTLRLPVGLRTAVP